MKHLISFLVMVLASLPLSISQATNANEDDGVSTFFEHIDLSQVETGILEEYGFHLVSPGLFSGELVDSVYANGETLKYLYIGLYGSQVNKNANMPEPEEISHFFDNYEGMTILYYKYNSFHPDALANGWIKVENDQIYLVDGQPSPYIDNYCFGVCFGEEKIETIDRTLRLKIDTSTLLTNLDVSVKQVEIATDGGEYKTVGNGETWTHQFEIFGPHRVAFRLTFSDGKKMESQSIFTLLAPKSSRLDSDSMYEKFATIEADGNQPGGELQAIYMDKEKTGGKFIRPLIIAGDMDLSELIGSKPLTLETLLQLPNVGIQLKQLSKLFDIIYLSYNNDKADLLNNGELFRRAVKLVNENRYSLSDDSYVVGLGVGGVIARIGLNLMEETGENHRVQKSISVNSPFRGISVPVTLQALVRQMYEFGQGLERYKRTKEYHISASVAPFKELLEKPAVQQLLINNLDNVYSYNTTTYASFINNKYVSTPPLRL